MTPLARHLAHLNSRPDLAALDIALVQAVAELLAPCTAALYGVTGEPDDRRWFERARSAGPGLGTAPPPLWLDTDRLPALASAPQRLACWRSGDGVSAVPDDGASDTTHRSWLPLRADEQAVGVVEVSAPLALPFAAPQLFDRLQRAYRQAHEGLALQLHDGLTGLPNRQAFEAQLARALAGLTDPAQAPPEPPALERRQAAAAGLCWLAVANLDPFRRFNEAQGHLQGDDVLVALGQRLPAVLRCQDRLFRWTGGRFVLLLHCPGEAQLRSVLARCVATAAELGAPLAPPLGLHIGFTALRPGDAGDAALARAEAALCLAKAGGEPVRADTE